MNELAFGLYVSYILYSWCDYLYYNVVTSFVGRMWMNRIIMLAITAGALYNGWDVVFWIGVVLLSINLLIFNPWSLSRPREESDENEMS